MTGGFGRFLRRNGIALVALFFALGGASYAASTALINGSKIKPHTIAKNRLTNKAIKQLKGNRGPQGAPGAPGAPGAQGPPGPGARWAEVNGDGTIAAQTGGITVLRGSAGRYFVNFGEDVSHRLLVVNTTITTIADFRGAPIVASCANTGGNVAPYCQAFGVTNLPDTAAVFTWGTDNQSSADIDFYIAEVGPNGTSAPVHAHAHALGQGVTSLSK